MSELRELYQTVIRDHNKNPRNFGTLEEPSHSADGNNPLCGDVIHVTLQVEDDVVRDLRFEGSGCAISTASASASSERSRWTPPTPRRAGTRERPWRWRRSRTSCSPA